MMDLQSLIAEIEPLTKDPIYLPEEHAREKVLPWIVFTIAAVTALYWMSWPIANQLFGEKQLDNKRKLCYQITNVITNLCLGIAGLYFEYRMLPAEPSIQGNEHIYHLPGAQIGYQVWGLVVGILLVDEKPEMLGHHLSLGWVACMPAFLVNGFRFWTPYYFGVVELSSVPLGIMNAFKDNKAWTQKYPRFYANIRLIFAITFLIISNVLLVPHLDYLRDLFLFTYLLTWENAAFKIYFMSICVGSFFLFYLQLYWGYLVASGVLKTITKPTKQQPAKQQ